MTVAYAAIAVGYVDHLGVEPELTRRSATDPSQDKPPIPLGGPMPFGASHEETDAWVEHWPGERVPALGQLTPRVAARRTDKRPHLERSSS